MIKKFQAKIHWLTILKCELVKREGSYEIINAREEGLNAFKINMLGLEIGFGPYDFNYFVEKEVATEGGVNKFGVYCNYKFLFIILPISQSKKIGEHEPEFWII